jgi:hypothetical protein
MLISAEQTFITINDAWKKEHGSSSLISTYELERMRQSAKKDLIYAAVKRALDVHGVQNVTIPEDAIDKLQRAEGFSVEAVEEAIKEPYLAHADQEAYNQLIKQAKMLIPWTNFDKPSTVQELVRGRVLKLRIHWFIDSVDSSSYDRLYALQILLKAHLTKTPLSQCNLDGASSIDAVIESFRDSKQPFNQARAYTYLVNPIDGFKVHKNGHIEIAFKEAEDAETAAKILLEQTLSPPPDAQATGHGPGQDMQGP